VILGSSTRKRARTSDHRNGLCQVDHRHGWVVVETGEGFGVHAAGEQFVYKLRTRTGLRIRATARHPFRMLHGWTALQDLRVGDRIAVARSIPVFGKTPIPDWEATLLGLMIAEGQCHTPGHSLPSRAAIQHWYACSRRSCCLRFGRADLQRDLRYRLVNRRGRGGVPWSNKAHAWLESYGLSVRSGDKFVPPRIFTAPRQSVRLFMQPCSAATAAVSRQWRRVPRILLEVASAIEDVRHLLLRFGVSR